MFNFMGWQPLHRPEQQRACGVRLTKGQDFVNLAVSDPIFRFNPVNIPVFMEKPGIRAMIPIVAGWNNLGPWEAYFFLYQT